MKFLAIVLLALVVVQAIPFTDLNKNSVTNNSDYEPNSEKMVDRIFGGTTVTDETKYPYMVWIRADNNKFCGGSIIASDMILTAARCVYEKHRFDIVAGDILLDSSSLKNAEQRRTADAESVTIYPNWDSAADLAIINLPTPFLLNAYVNTIEIEHFNQDVDRHAEQTATIIGYGSTSDTSTYSKSLQEVNEVKIIKNIDCENHFSKNIHHGMMCIDFSTAKRTCPGDTGGPLTKFIRETHVLIGIVSADFSGDGCNENDLSIFTRTAYFHDWINNQIKARENLKMCLNKQRGKSGQQSERILGGTKVTDQKKHPHQVWISLRYDIGQHIARCGGSIIAANKILTAAHCFQGFSYCRIGTGEFKKEYFESSPPQNTRSQQYRDVTIATSVVKHPNWNTGTGEADIAIITLSDPFIMNEFVNFIPLDVSNKDDPDKYEDGQTTISGYGWISDQSPSSQFLMEANNMIVIAHEDCACYFKVGVHEGQICIKTTNGKSICRGDSGGPLTKNINSQTTLIGVASSSSQGGCNQGYPAEFARVGYYREWIDDQIKLPKKNDELRQIV